MKNATKTLLFSVMALFICTSLIVGGTYALFTDTVDVNTHLKAGNLDVTLKCTKYSYTVLTEDGIMKTVDADTCPDLSTNKPLFKDMKAVPTTKHTATVFIGNAGSTAFTYGVRITWNGVTSDNDKALANQIKITIVNTMGTLLDTSDDVTKTFMLANCESADNDFNLGYLLAGENNETAGEGNNIIITAEFLDDGRPGVDTNVIKNNDAMNGEVTFDIQVYAVQMTEMPTTETAAP